MRPFSFVHAGDLHLDSSFKGITAESPEIASHLRAATFEAFNRVIDLCIERRASFLLIAGDVYDAEDRSLKAQLHLRDGLESLARHNIRAFVVHGNHDPYGSRACAIQWPDNTYIFGCENVQTVSVDVDGSPVALISGISYPRRDEKRNLVKKFQTTDLHPPPVSVSNIFHIGLLHCNVGTNTGHESYAPCTLSDFNEANIR